MRNVSLVMGNSSMGILESAIHKTPVVNIGTRQQKRMRDSNVIDVDYDSDAILNAIKQQINHGKYTSSSIYGDGTAGTQIANILETITPKIQKTITY